jgi:hypothetical protein
MLGKEESVKVQNILKLGWALSILELCYEAVQILPIKNSNIK